MMSCSVYPTLSRSLCFPPALTHLWQDTARLKEDLVAPVNISLKGTIPELTNNNVLSL